MPATVSLYWMGSLSRDGRGTKNEVRDRYFLWIGSEQTESLGDECDSCEKTCLMARGRGEKRCWGAHLS